MRRGKNETTYGYGYRRELIGIFGNGKFGHLNK